MAGFVDIASEAKRSFKISSIGPKGCESQWLVKNTNHGVHALAVFSHTTVCFPFKYLTNPANTDKFITEK